MLQANELRIGNALEYFVEDSLSESEWILNIVDADDIALASKDEYFNKYYRPIPLTPKILEKCGFEKTNRLDFGELKPCYAKFSFALMLRHESYFIDWVGGNTEIKYLHQLQNLYFALTGEELTFKP